jgi:hypothetical protein
MKTNMKKTVSILMIVSMLLALFPVSAQAAPGVNYISNASAENMNSTTGLPVDWSKGQSGVNNAQFSVSNDAYEGSKSLMVSISSYTSGDAKWYFKPIKVNPNTSYTFSDYYKSTVASSLFIRLSLIHISEPTRPY